MVHIRRGRIISRFPVFIPGGWTPAAKNRTLHLFVIALAREHWKHKRSMNAIPYQLAGGKLTLTIDGKETVYFRKRRK